MALYNEEIDCRLIDLRKPANKDYCDKRNILWITESAQEHSKMIPIWRKNQDYYEGEATPLGFSSDFMKEFVRKNSDTLLRDEDENIFMPVNNIRPVIDRWVGEYTEVKKAVTAEPKNPRYSKLVPVVGNLIEHYNDDKELWELVYTPTIEDILLLGCGWVDVKFNARRKLPTGDIEFENVSTFEILVDPLARKKYFDNSRYRIRVRRYEINEARNFLTRFGVNPNAVQPDNDWSNYIQNKDDLQLRLEYCTLYFIQYKKTYTNPYKMNGNQVSFADTIQEADFEEEEDYYFQEIYNKGLGTVYHVNNRLKTWTLLPGYGKRSRRRTYPLSDGENIIPLNDIFNITNTLLMADVRKSVKEHYTYDSEDFAKNIDLAKAWLRRGGVFPVGKGEKISRVEKGDMNPLIMQMLELSKKYMDDASYQYEPQRGEYPEYDMSGKALTILDLAARRPNNYKDQNISWLASQVGNVVYRIAAVYFTEEHFIKILDMSRKSKIFAPIRSKMTIPQYENYLKENDIGVDKFEESNDVNYVTAADPNPERAMMNAHVIINDLNEDAEFAVKVKFDFNAERDQQFKKALALELRKMNLQGRKRTLVDLGKSDSEAEQTLKELDEENQVMLIAKELEAMGPQAMQLVKQIIERTQMQKQLNPGQRVPTQ